MELLKTGSVYGEEMKNQDLMPHAGIESSKCQMLCMGSILSRESIDFSIGKNDTSEDHFYQFVSS